MAKEHNEKGERWDALKAKLQSDNKKLDKQMKEQEADFARAEE